VDKLKISRYRRIK